jgi:DNA-binding PucR family transcriptional regulator
MSAATYVSPHNGRVYRDGMPPDGGASPADQRMSSRELVAAVGMELNLRLTEVTQDLLDRLVSEVPEIAADDRLVQLMSASIEANVDTIVHMLRHSIDVERTVAPSAAIEYARRVAQQGLPVNALVRCYRLGQERFLRWSLEELQRQSDDALTVSNAALEIVADTSAYIDRVSQHVVEVYEEERERWLVNRSASRSARVRELLDGRALDIDSAENTLGYRLRQHHVAVVAWADKNEDENDELAYLERAMISLAAKLDLPGKPLFVPCDELSAWSWLPLGSRRTFDTAALADIVEGWDRPVKLAVGTPGAGIRGFSHTHKQAKQAQAVALAARLAGPATVAFADVGGIALMCTNLETTRAWVADTLGALAVDDDSRARLRETVRTFLASGSSYTAAADQLNMHRNSVVYRLHKAEEELGHPLRDGRLQLELALDVCHWLGSIVLVPGGQSAPDASL